MLAAVKNKLVTEKIETVKLYMTLSYALENFDI